MCSSVAASPAGICCELCASRGVALIRVLPLLRGGVLVGATATGGARVGAVFGATGAGTVRLLASATERAEIAVVGRGAGRGTGGDRVRGGDTVRTAATFAGAVVGRLKYRCEGVASAEVGVIAPILREATVLLAVELLLTS